MRMEETTVDLHVDAHSQVFSCFLELYLLPTQLVYQDSDGVFLEFCIADEFLVLYYRVINEDNVGDRGG